MVRLVGAVGSDPALPFLCSKDYLKNYSNVLVLHLLDR